MTNDQQLRSFAGLFIKDARTRRVVIEAESLEEATEIAKGWNVGITEEVVGEIAPDNVLPEAYDEKTARRLLGGISRSTLYAWLVTGELERVPDTRRVLVTRSSIERRCRSRP